MQDTIFTAPDIRQSNWIWNMFSGLFDGSWMPKRLLEEARRERLVMQAHGLPTGLIDRHIENLERAYRDF